MNEIRTNRDIWEMAKKMEPIPAEHKGNKKIVTGFKYAEIYFLKVLMRLENFNVKTKGLKAKEIVLIYKNNGDKAMSLIFYFKKDIEKFYKEANSKHVIRNCIFQSFKKHFRDDILG